MLHKWNTRPEGLVLAASLAFMAMYNFALWQHLSNILPRTWESVFLALSLALMIMMLFNIVMLTISFRWLLKPALILLFMVSSFATYFMVTYGVLIDPDMVRNIFETDSREVTDLLSLKLMLYVIILGILPSIVVWKTPISYRPVYKGLLAKLAAAVLSVTVLAVIALLQYQGLASLLRNHHELRLLVVPSNYINATYHYVAENFRTPTKIEAIGTDAQQLPSWNNHKRPSLTVLVVGESARRENFGLFGYPRDTTSNLKQQQGLLSFDQVTSCGTATAISLPCMLSKMNRANYDATVAKSQESVLDILQRAGLSVKWVDNQSGCKGTCDRIPSQSFRDSHSRQFCGDGECHDEILVSAVNSYLEDIEEDSVLVLHQMGNHGPDYYKRYPKEFEKFSPVCSSNSLNECSREEIVNTYDNIVVYTDYVLSKLVDALKVRQDKVDVALIYISDHGESLGEYNLYLHGSPYFMAPSQQTDIPMLMWFSDSYLEDFALDESCISERTHNPYSHDNLFHSVLGLLEIGTDEYQANEDIFSGCRNYPEYENTRLAG